MKRRSFIGTTMTIPLVGISGCIGDNTSKEKLDSQNYPDGLSKNDVDIAELLSSDSVYLQSDSVTISIEQNSGNGTTDLTVKVNSSVPASRVRSVSTFQGNTQTVDRYFIEGISYVRRSANNSETYQKENQSFDKQNEYYVQFIKNILTGVSFSSHEVSDDLLVYEAQDLSDFKETSQFIEDDVVDASVTVRFTKEGLFDSIETQVERSKGDESQDTYKSDQSISFSMYNQTSVSEPDWLDTAKRET